MLFLSLLSILVSPALSPILATSNTFHTEPQRVFQTSSRTPFKSNVFPSSFLSSAPVVNLEKSNFTGEIILRYDSVVEIKDSFFGNPSWMSDFYLYNNSMLILDNVTFLHKIGIKLYDSSVLIIKNSNAELPDHYISLYDKSQVSIFNTTMEESSIGTHDNSSAYLNNVTIQYLYSGDNSSILANNITISNSFVTGMHFSGNANVTFVNSHIGSFAYVYQSAAITIENTTSSTFIKLYGNSTVTLENSSFDDLFLYTDFTKATIINSTINTLYVRSKAVSEVYNSTIAQLHRGFIISGTATYKNDAFKMSSGTFQFNVVNDSDTTINTIYNLTFFYLTPSSNLTITQNTLPVYKVAVTNAYLYVNSTDVNYILSDDNSEIHLYNLTLMGISVEDSRGELNETTITNGFSAEKSNINIYHSQIQSLFSFYNSEGVWSDCKIDSMFINNAYVNASYLTISSWIQSYGNTTLNITHGLLNMTGTPWLINTSFIARWVNLSYVSVNLDPNSTFVVTDSLMKNIQIDSSHSTLQFENCSGAYANITLYDSVMTMRNSTTDTINVFSNSSVYIQEDSLINTTKVDPDANANLEIANSTIKVLNVESLGSQVTSFNSNFNTVRYMIYISSGSVNITDNEIVSSSASIYNTTFAFDSKTIVDNLFLTFLYVDSAVVYLTNQTIRNVAYITNSEAHLYNVSSSESYSLAEVPWMLINAHIAKYMFLKHHSPH